MRVRGPGKGPGRERDIIPECNRREIKCTKEGSETQYALKGDLIQRLRNAELKVMTWNLADFSNKGVVQGKLWNNTPTKGDRNARQSDTGTQKNKKASLWKYISTGKHSGGKKSSSHASAPETPAEVGRLPFVADTIADEAPDVVFIQEVTTSDGGEKAMEELTDELNTMMKSREPDVWINDEAVHLPPKFKMKEKIEYKLKLSDVLKGGPGAERYGCVWNESKFKQGPDVRYLKDKEALLDILEVLIRDKAKERLAEKLFTKVMEEFKKAMEKCQTENFSEIFSRTPALFTFTPKYGGPKVNNEINNKIHFLVFHLTSSNPKSGGAVKNEKEMEVLLRLARHVWDEGSRLILLGDHNAGECHTITSKLKTLTHHHGENILNKDKEIKLRRLVVSTKERTNLFPFIKGSGTRDKKQEKSIVIEYAKFLKDHLSDEDFEPLRTRFNLTIENGTVTVVPHTIQVTDLEKTMYEHGFSDFIRGGGGKHNDNIIIPPENRCRSSGALVRNQEVFDLRLLKARVLEVPVDKLMEYTIKNDEPLGSWKYLWSDHRPVVARFSLS